MVGHTFTFRSNVSPRIAISPLEPLLEPSGRSEPLSGDGFVVDKLVGIFSVLVAEVEHRRGGCVSIGLVPSCPVRRRSEAHVSHVHRAFLLFPLRFVLFLVQDAP